MKYENEHISWFYGCVKTCNSESKTKDGYIKFVSNMYNNPCMDKLFARYPRYGLVLILLLR